MVGKRYAVADLHGQSNLYFQIKEYINGNDTVYALGDFGDRGPEPWATLQLALDDPQFIYLMGNHDFMLMEAMKEYMDIVAREGWCNIWQYAYCTKGKIGLLFPNGGVHTLEQWANLDEEKRMKYYWKLKQLPLEVRLAALDGKRFIYLNHAGYTPGCQEPTNVDDFVWNCDHWYDSWGRKDGALLINGHSPIQVLKKNLRADTFDDSKEYLQYCDGHKICIDLGSYSSKETILLDIDTLEAKKFKVREEVNGTEKN